MKKYILALDQGTTSSRAVIFNQMGQVISIKNRPIKQYYPHPGWVEHHAEEIYQVQVEAIFDCLNAASIKPEEIAAIGITNQRETVVLWDKETGKPIHPAICWQCRRTSEISTSLKENDYENLIWDKTGLVIDAYFSATKIKWLLDNVPNARKMANERRLLAGTMDTWLIWNLTGGKVHATDYSNASRTMLYNIFDLKWDAELLELLDIPKSLLPKVVPSSGFIGETYPELFGISIPICGAAGDQQAALFGQTCYTAGSVKNTYGTGCFILMNTGFTPVKSKNRLLTTIAWDTGFGVEYALEGSVFNGGAAIQWIRDELKLVKTPQEADIIAENTPDTGGVYLVPAFTGLGAPYWDMYARGAILGLTRGSTRNHIIRATLESIAYQSIDVFNAMVSDSGVSIQELKVDGGASNSDFLMQFQADLLGIDVIRPLTSETTALGAAFLAGLGVGFWESKKQIQDIYGVAGIFKPNMDRLDAKKLYKGWQKAVERAMDWEK